jgi:uncharacterized membrane protein YtjA (UPF0391 family)
MGVFKPGLVLQPHARPADWPPARALLASGFYSAHVVRVRCGVVQEDMMLKYAIVFVVISLIAGALGFGGVAAGAAGIAKILFGLFLILAVIFVVLAALGVGAVKKVLK